jgi:hypothetical protein
MTTKAFSSSPNFPFNLALKLRRQPNEFQFSEIKCPRQLAERTQVAHMTCTGDKKRRLYGVGPK